MYLYLYLYIYIKTQIRKEKKIQHTCIIMKTIISWVNPYSYSNDTSKRELVSFSKEQNIVLLMSHYMLLAFLYYFHYSYSKHMSFIFRILFSQKLSVVAFFRQLWNIIITIFLNSDFCLRISINQKQLYDVIHPILWAFNFQNS